jgi:hypothetical protein
MRSRWPPAIVRASGSSRLRVSAQRPLSAAGRFFHAPESALKLEPSPSDARIPLRHGVNSPAIVVRR